MANMRSKVMKKAWILLREIPMQDRTKSIWSECLKKAWNLVKNDKIDIDTIYNTYYNQVLSFVRFKINNTESAIELTQDSFIKLNEHLESFDSSKGSLKSYLFTIVNRKIIDHYRKKRMNVVNISDYTDDSGKETYEFIDNSYEGESIENKELSGKIDNSFAKLKGNYRDVAELYFIHQKKYHEIAEILNMPMNSVKVTLLRAKKKLAEQLKGEYSQL